MTSTSEAPAPSNAALLDRTTAIASAYLAKNAVPADTVPAFLERVFETLCKLEKGGTELVPAFQNEGASHPPAVPVDQSVQHEHIICLEDGKKLRMLKRYLMARYGLTPDAYRQKWGLPADYPMSAPAVSEKRRADAFDRGLGMAAAPRRRARGRGRAG